MAIASSFPVLDTWAQALAVVLLLELLVLLLLVAALMFALAFGARWLQTHVIPVLNATVPRAKQALDLASQGNDRVVRGVAEVHGWRSALETGLKVFFQGREPGSLTDEEIQAAQTDETLEMDAERQAALRSAAREMPAAGADAHERERWAGDRHAPPAAHAG